MSMPQDVRDVLTPEGKTVPVEFNFTEDVAGLKGEFTKEDMIEFCEFSQTEYTGQVFDEFDADHYFRLWLQQRNKD